MNLSQKRKDEHGQINPTNNMYIQHQSRDSKQSQQQSPTFQSSLQNLTLIDHQQTQDTYSPLMTQELAVNNNGDKQIQNNDENLINNQNKDKFQTLNNSIDKLFCCNTTQDDQEMNNLIIFRDFQSDSKANSKYGSVRESKQGTPKYTPRFNLNHHDITHNSTHCFPKPQNNLSNYQSQESFCYKEDKNQNNFNPNSHYDSHNHFYNIQQIQNNYNHIEQQNFKTQQNEYYPYMIYQKNGQQYYQEEEQQQQLNSYHLPQQKKKKMMINMNGKGNQNQQNIQNQQRNNNNNTMQNLYKNNQENNYVKQIPMMIMMPQTLANVKEKIKNKLVANQNDSYNFNDQNMRICQTEPSQEYYSEYNQELIQKYQEMMDQQQDQNYLNQRREEQNMRIGNHKRIQQLPFNTQKLGINSMNNKNNSSLKKNNPQISNKNGNNNDNLEDFSDEEQQLTNNQEPYYPEQTKINQMNDQLKMIQSITDSSQKQNNYGNQKKLFNQMNKIKQQINNQQIQFNEKNNQKSIYEGNQSTHQNKIMKRVNTNPLGVGSSEINVTPERVGSGDFRNMKKVALISNSKNQQQNNDINRLNSKGFINQNESLTFNHQNRKFRQMSAHTNSNNNKYNILYQNENKNNHLIDEDYNKDESTLNNHLQSEQRDEQMLGQLNKLQNNFVRSQSRGKYQPQSDFNNLISSQYPQFQKRQNDNKPHQSNSINNFQDKQILKKKIQEFDKKKNLNLNINLQPNPMIPKPQYQPQISSTLSTTSVAQQDKKSLSLSKRKKVKPRSQSPQNLSLIKEQFQKSDMKNINEYDNQNKQQEQKAIYDKQQNLNSGKFTNQNNNLEKLNTLSSQKQSNQIENTQHYICKTEGDDSQSSLQIGNIDEIDSNNNQKIDQLSTSGSMSNKFTKNNQLENSLNNPANQSLYAKQTNKRIQSASYNTSNTNYTNDRTNNLIEITNKNQEYQDEQSSIQNKNIHSRGRFNSSHNTTFQQSNNIINSNNNQQLFKKVNIVSQSQTTTNHSQQNNQITTTNLLVKNQLKKRSYTPQSANLSFVQPSLQDTLNLKSKPQTHLTIKKLSRNQKSSQQNEFNDSFNLINSPFPQPQSPISLQMLQINSHFQQQQQQQNLQQQQNNNIYQQGFPNVQKQQLVKRNEMNGINNNNNINSQNQQILQNPPLNQPVRQISSAQGQSQQINKMQMQQEKNKSINPNQILNQTLSTKLNKIQ